MGSRENILSAIAKNQPEFSPWPEFDFPIPEGINLIEKFCEVLTNIGGKAIEINNFDELIKFTNGYTEKNQRVISNLPELSALAESISTNEAGPASLQNMELAIIKAHFGVAENGAVWITEELVAERALPFICQHLAVVIKKQDIVASMQHAYERIGSEKYGFGTFIAGPSKTADIEQSLVLGAHGARTMTVFILQ